VYIPLTKSFLWQKNAVFIRLWEHFSGSFPRRASLVYYTVYFTFGSEIKNGLKFAILNFNRRGNYCIFARGRISLLKILSLENPHFWLGLASISRGLSPVADAWPCVWVFSLIRFFQDSWGFLILLEASWASHPEPAFPRLLETRPTFSDCISTLTESLCSQDSWGFFTFVEASWASHPETSRGFIIYSQAFNAASGFLRFLDSSWSFLSPPSKLVYAGRSWSKLI
jgi:hypothetical protein